MKRETGLGFMTEQSLQECRDQVEGHLERELLPFWIDRCEDRLHGGFLTHFDKDGRATGEDEKTLIGQSRLVYTMSAAHMAGRGEGRCAELAAHGVDFLLEKMWDREHGGFFWTTDRRGRVRIDQKVLYGQAFAIYSLSQYTLATGDSRGIECAERAFGFIQEHCADSHHGGYREIFDRRWRPAGPGPEGGDRKNLDVHMHLMEAFTPLYQCSRKPVHREKLLDVIQVLVEKMLHPEYGTGIPQFTLDWRPASHIKYNIVWGLDRFSEGGEKPHGEDDTSYGHNAELAWLLLHALKVIEEDPGPYLEVIGKLLHHTADHGIDGEYGGVYVEGSHAGPVHDREKEFWQQAEVMIGMLDGCLLFGPEKFWPAYEKVHRFVFSKVINHQVGEWRPLLSREGKPIWTAMGHSWKINYHTVRCMLECARRLDSLQTLS